MSHELRTQLQRLLSRRALIVFVAALGVRLAYWAIFLHHYVPLSDAEHYNGIARNLAAGLGFSHDYPSMVRHATAFRPPLYPLLLGGLYWLFGTHLAVAQAANAVIGSASVVIGSGLAARVGGRRAGVVAALALMLFPPLIANDLVPLSEPLSLLLFLVTASLLAARRYELAAIATGLLVLGRSSAQGVVALVALWLVFAVGWRIALRYSAIAVLVVIPWVVRNEVQLHTASLVTSDGFNLAAIYSPEARQSYPRLQFVDPVYDARFAPDWPQRADEARWDHLLLQRGLTGITQAPGRIPGLFMSHMEQLLELGRIHNLNISSERSDGRNMPLRNHTMWLLYPVAVLGAAGLWRHRRSREVQFLGGLALYFLVMAALFVPAPRLRAPLDVACCIGVGLLLAPPSRRPRTIDLRHDQPTLEDVHLDPDGRRDALRV
jgi:4-amino-4-deoxy-L-arabinose transferase-like glycosyltransferase